MAVRAFRILCSACEKWYYESLDEDDYEITCKHCGSKGVDVTHKPKAILGHPQLHEEPTGRHTFALSATRWRWRRHVGYVSFPYTLSYKPAKVLIVGIETDGASGLRVYGISKKGFHFVVTSTSSSSYNGGLTKVSFKWRVKKYA